ncbi:peptidase [Gordonibacter massiliensis (ex Traore et al. 2017)]|uniref:Peptidase n=1 Tax=Gordonibacter massiliensis (ex Traore et al. 2017) TaxID=1841863 RepID=A0A842JGU3_9ACTN|nr:peptidase [Gordonibacter massiliensis (ex Traore et al. 2017)]MBC2888280.1 peptidase [Gordonibacter massiliensis (ex Traore et al. 2017)]MBX9032918.1 peptidase [Gordonibacter massiliensis (ex Traore et al. 2017)]
MDRSDTHAGFNRKAACAFGAIALSAMLAATCTGCSTTSNDGGNASADDAIKAVYSHNFVDIDGAKTDAVIVEYADAVKADSVSADDYQVNDYALFQSEQKGAAAFERGSADTAGSIVDVYVNDTCDVSENGGTDSGKYVVIEVETDYLLAGNTPAYTKTTMAGVTQVGEVAAGDKTIAASTKEKCNYTATEQEKFNREGESQGMETVVATDPDYMLFPELVSNENWKIGEAFKAVDCFSEYTGEASSFDLTYSLYVPDLSDADKGHVAVALHILDAGSLGEDPMLTLTESQAPVDWASDEVQSLQKTIVICPQVPEEQRSSNDYVATSEVNTAAWELLDSVIAEYADYVDTDRIYGTGQSMGGMTLMDMAAQRDNFFGGFWISGSQWSNCYNKDVASEGQVARTPENDPNTFIGDYANDPNYENWYYQISDDNILVMNCEGDAMSHGLWDYTDQYFAAAGANIAKATWSPNDSLDEQNAAVETLTNQNTGINVNWASFEGGDHMSTWKYSYDIKAGFKWLVQQTRSAEMARDKVAGLNNPWLGRDESGAIVTGSGTLGLNSAFYTPQGADECYSEGWTPESVVAYKAAHPEEKKQGGPTGK